MGDAETKRREEFLEQQNSFRTNAVILMKYMLGLVEKKKKNTGSEQLVDEEENTGSEQEEKKRRKKLVDEMLHSIFFLGQIHKVPFPPEMIIPDEVICNDLKNEYPRPFEFCTSQLPKRSPFSYVLDMTVEKEKPENEEEIKARLKGLVQPLKTNFLVSSTICISQESNSCNKYYGVSMSTNGAPAGRIVVAASCFSAWDDYVARAVMTYYPHKDKRAYFDATIKLPVTVRCKAFSIRRESNEEMMPCKSCVNLFGLSTSDEKKQETEWAYGNCAEAESVSNLLKNEAEVKSQTTVQPFTNDSLKKAKDSVMKTLKNDLKDKQFTWHDTYYSANL